VCRLGCACPGRRSSHTLRDACAVGFVLHSDAATARCSLINQKIASDPGRRNKTQSLTCTYDIGRSLEVMKMSAVRCPETSKESLQNPFAYMFQGKVPKFPFAQK